MATETFSMKVRREAAEAVSGRRHCQLAELAGLFSLGDVTISENRVEFTHENAAVAKKVFTLLKKTYKIIPMISVQRRRNHRARRGYRITVLGEASVRELLMGIKHPALQGHPEQAVDDLLLQKSCCKRAFVRGCFLAGGSVTDPAKGYHLEMICPTEEKAKQLCRVIDSFWAEEDYGTVKYTVRRRSEEDQVQVVYMKEGDQIADFLNLCECYRALMEMENIRVTKEIANSLNRRQNCEMANMVKTISAAQMQKEDIQYLDEHIGIDRLPVELREIARLRLQDTEMTIKELGEALDPPVGKSCVNHRLRKIKKMADDLRDRKEN